MDSIYSGRKRYVIFFFTILFCFVGLSWQVNAAKLTFFHSVSQDSVAASEAVPLEEVIFTGYGEFKKSTYTGAVSLLETQHLKDVPALSFIQILQGSVPGVQVLSASGLPGAATAVNIRGIGSINASRNPLFVVDGVPVIYGNISAIETPAGLDIMGTLNVSDIERIAIIKDASAAALYGTRAANGVVLITTKKGHSGKSRYSFKADIGWVDFAMRNRPVMKGEERREVIWEALRDGQMVYDGKTEAEAVAYADEEIERYAPLPWNGYQNWHDMMFSKGMHQAYGFTASGGTDRMKHYASLSYTNQKGVNSVSGVERITGLVNVGYQASPRLDIGAKVLFSSFNQDVYAEGMGYTAPMYSSVVCATPSDPVYNKDGTWNRNFIRNDDRNPKLAEEYNYKREYVIRSFNTLYASYQFFRGLKLKSTISYDFIQTKGRNWFDPRTSDGDHYNGSLEKSMIGREKLVWSTVLNYQQVFAGKHDLDVSVGYEIDDQSQDYVQNSVANFARPDKAETSNGVIIGEATGYENGSRLVSYVSRLNYNYRNKYYIGASYRVDGSSRLHRDNRWGSFWAVSGAWKLSAEDFMSPTQSWLSDLKLRVSYGVNGALPSALYGYMNSSGLVNSYDNEPGMFPIQYGNKSLSWESNYSLNTGLDFDVWDRLHISVDYYIRRTKDLLLPQAVSMTTGFMNYLTNVGEIKNEGIEFELVSKNFVGKDFNWMTSFHISRNKNSIVHLNGQTTALLDQVHYRGEGKPFNTFYLMEFAGINPDNGMPLFYTNAQDAEGKYIKELTEDVSQVNYIPIKNADPKFIGGLSNYLQYKMIDLNVVFSYQLGGYTYDTWAQRTENGGGDLKTNIPTYYRNRWKKAGDKAKYERFIAGNNILMSDYRNSRRLHSSDFIRLKHITLGVSLPEVWINRIGLDKVRLYAAGSNMWTWAQYDYYDPEASNGGITIWGTPPLKTMTFGVEVNF